MGEERLLEKLAELEHKQWCGWLRWQFSCLESPERERHLARWRRQMVTPYAELSEREQESDRAEARKVLAAALRASRSALAAELAALRRVVRSALSERDVLALRERAEQAERDLAAFPEPRSMVALDMLYGATAERDHASADLAAVEAAMLGEKL